MKEIPIISEGKTISRILTGRRVEEVACLPEGDVFLVYDRAVEPLADAFAKALAQNEGARFGGKMSLETSEAGKTLDTVMEALMTLGLGFGLIASAVLTMCVL